jgi:hypothetical protein
VWSWSGRLSDRSWPTGLRPSSSFTASLRRSCLLLPHTRWWCAGTDQPDFPDHPPDTQSDYVISAPLRAETCCCSLQDRLWSSRTLQSPWSLPLYLRDLKPQGGKLQRCICDCSGDTLQGTDRPCGARAGWGEQSVYWLLLCHQPRQKGTYVTPVQWSSVKMN